MKLSISNSRMISWILWVFASLFYAYQYILRVMPNIMLDDIMQKFNISTAAFGQFSGIYYIGYSLMHLPIGILLDRYGPKKVIPSCILLTVVGLMPLIMADYWVYPILGRLLIGIGSSAAILGVFKIIRMTFDEKLFPRMLSLSVTIGLIGAIYGGGPVSYMRDTLGYDIVLKLLALMGLILAIVTYWIVPSVKKRSEETVISNVMEVLSNKKVVLSCIFAGLMVGPLEGFADVWGTVFLNRLYKFDGTLAASLPSMIFIGMCFGSPILSFIADKAKSYLGTIIVSGIIMASGFFLILTQMLSITFISFNFVLIGVCCAYQILAIYKISTFVREEVVGLTTAVANMIIMIFGYIFHAIIGLIINSLGGTDKPDALFYGISIIPIALFVGTIGFSILFILERKTNKIFNLK